MFFFRLVFDQIEFEKTCSSSQIKSDAIEVRRSFNKNQIIVRAYDELNVNGDKMTRFFNV